MDITILSPDGTTRLDVIVASDLATVQTLHPDRLCVERGSAADLAAADVVLAAVAPAPRIVPAWQFRDRFTHAELSGITHLAYSGTGDAVAQLLLLKVATSTEGVNLDSPEVAAGLDYLVGKGVLAPARAAEVLS